MRALVLGVAMVALLVGHASASRASTPTSEVMIGAVLPNITLRGINGRSRKLSEYRGKALLINVWASWCGPCQQESASLERLAWLGAARQFNIIAVSTDDDIAQSLQWLRRSNATISQFIDTGRQMEEMLGATRLPLTVLVAADGRILRKIYGGRAWDSADSLQLLESVFRGARCKAQRDLAPAAEQGRRESRGVVPPNLQCRFFEILCEQAETGNVGGPAPP